MERAGSGESRIGPEPGFLAFSSLGDFPELALDRPGFPKGLPVHFFEGLVGRVEDKPACQPHGDADGPALKFDCKSLHCHSIFSWRGPGRTDAPRVWAVALSTVGIARAVSDAFRALFEMP